MADKTVYRKDYEPYPFQIKTTALEFDLFDNHALVRNRMELTRQGQGALCLYGDELELVSIEMNDEPMELDTYEMRDGDLLLTHCPDQFTLTIVTRIQPQKNTELSGLYRTQNLFCTQCEAEGFRRITFYPDRPDVLSQYTTKITADKNQYPILLSNGNLIDTGSLDNNRHWALWSDPFKKPSYLFALVAGDLACVKDTFTTGTGRVIDLRLYVEPGNEDKCTHALESLKRAMRWDEDEYGREYDLDIFMIVAVSDFNMGAMENKGLNVFNSKYVLARPDTATDQDYADIEGVVGHEYFHNWTGNRITCRDWFQLSLKEGLTVFRDQEFSRDMNSREVNRIHDVRILRNTQFPEDSGAMAHPVRPDSYQEINNFYTATVYNKGAEVIRMQQTLLGKAGFRRGMDLYFQRHDGHAVTIDDFVKAMEDANQVDFTQFKQWYSQAGTPEIQASETFHNGTLTVTLNQSCRPTSECQDKKPFHIPIRMALFDENGREIPVEQDVLELRKPQEIFKFSGFVKKPLISLLRGFSAPVLLQFEQSAEDLTALLRHETDGYAKWNAAQSLATSAIVNNYHHHPERYPLSALVTEAFQHVLQDDALDESLRAELLMPPGFDDVALRLDKVNVGRLESVRDFYRSGLGEALYATAESYYHLLWKREDHTMTGRAFSRRKLRNVCLWLMMKANESQALSACQTQFIQARTMTDQIASFALLVNSSSGAIRQQAIDAFYQQWQNDELVLDKWFAIQATCEKADALENVQSLLTHPAFNLKNPNKVRSLIGAFCFSNQRNFHAEDGSGYGFLSDSLLRLDKYNPQVAARLATPFTRWQKLDDKRQTMVLEQLKLLAAEDLSRDLRELVSKSLDA